jgi:hypothetical protein
VSNVNITATNFAKQITADIAEGSALDAIEASVVSGEFRIKAFLKSPDGNHYTRYELTETLSDAEVAVDGDAGLARAQAIAGSHATYLEFDSGRELLDADATRAELDEWFDLETEGGEDICPGALPSSAESISEWVTERRARTLDNWGKVLDNAATTEWVGEKLG